MVARRPSRGRRARPSIVDGRPFTAKCGSGRNLTRSGDVHLGTASLPVTARASRRRRRVIIPRLGSRITDREHDPGRYAWSAPGSCPPTLPRAAARMRWAGGRGTRGPALRHEVTSPCPVTPCPRRQKRRRLLIGLAVVAGIVGLVATATVASGKTSIPSADETAAATARVLDASDWYLTLPTGSKGKPDTVATAEAGRLLQQVVPRRTPTRTASSSPRTRAA